MSWKDFLMSFLIPDVIGVAYGWIMSFVVEHFPRWENVAPRWKRLVFLGICLILPVAAMAIASAFGYYDGTFVNTYWPALVAGGLAFASGTTAHTRKL